MGLAFGPTFEGVGEWALRPAGAVPELRNWDGRLDLVIRGVRIGRGPRIARSVSAVPSREVTVSWLGSAHARSRAN